MHGLDKLGRFAVIAQRVPQFADAHFEHDVADVSFRPHGAEHLLLGHQLTGVLQQIQQHGKTLLPQRNDPGPAPQQLINPVEAAVEEADLAL
jgi:hypothetical protein